MLTKFFGCRKDEKASGLASYMQHDAEEFRISQRPVPDPDESWRQSEAAPLDIRDPQNALADSGLWEQVLENLSKDVPWHGNASRLVEGSHALIT